MARVALVGNPNVGKSTVFNALTGSHRHVGNWPGTTVHIGTGCWVTPAGPVEVVDLPGTYSLQPRSPDQQLVRDLLVDRTQPGHPDVVVVIVDAANLSRNLYLLAQVLDVGIPVVVALTMADIAAGRGIRVDDTALSQQLELPVAPLGPRARDGRNRLAETVVATLGGPAPATPVLGVPIEAAVGELIARIVTTPGMTDRFSSRWLALGLLTGDVCGDACAELRLEAERLRTRLRADNGVEDDVETAIAEQRYAWVHRVVAACLRRDDRAGQAVSDRLDRVLTSRWLGPPIFLLVMWGVFVAATMVAAPLRGGLTSVVDGPVRDAVRWLLGVTHLAGTWVAGLVLDGMVSDVGQLLSFVPLVVIMFVLLAVLEDSGYLARAAFLADRFLRPLGLPGRAFLPLIVGFGCNVPSVVGTRILDDARHRLLTCLLVPYVTCSARLTVYLLVATVFFGDRAGSVVFAMYVLSVALVALVVLVGLALRHTVFRHHVPEPLLLELPPYRLPTARLVATQTWQQLVAFLRKAGGLVLTTVTAVWLLTAIPLCGGGFGTVDVSGSLYGGISAVVAPVFAPAGFGDWHATGALVTGFVAKEAVVSTFAQTYGASAPSGADTGDLDTRLRTTFDQSSGGHIGAAALAFLVFLLAYTPCMATVAAQRAEIGARWTCIGIGMQLAVAWVLATLVFQIGRLIT
ncbi:ferrous iron transport protein B [Actinophytocola sp.]|uniref:ferrous iron transport protein B n=1 Tax=Actinophytocola sp. TaxID=1872138 RepID=UPI0025BFCED7|nr:ferrous iron transport protein B [Actinophytocola sp.]